MNKIMEKCKHKRISRYIDKSKSYAFIGFIFKDNYHREYDVCLDCGKRFQ